MRKKNIEIPDNITLACELLVEGLNISPAFAQPMSDDIYRKILDLFIGRNKSSPAIAKPFIQDKYAIATDGCIIICFESSLLKEVDFESHPQAPNALAVIPDDENMKVVFETNYIRTLIEKSNKLAKETYAVTQSKCPDCNGSGYVDFEFKDYRGKKHEIEDSCPTCNEEYEWFTIVQKSTGDEIDDFKELFLIKGVLFDVEYLEKIVMVAEMLNVKTFSLVQRGHIKSINKFKVGECVICLMPVASATDYDLVENII